MIGAGTPRMGAYHHVNMASYVYTTDVGGDRFLAVLRDGTLYTGRDPVTANQPLGSVAADGSVRDLMGRQVGYVDGEGHIFKGVPYAFVHMGDVGPDGRYSGDAPRRLRGEGPEAAKACAVISLLSSDESAKGATRRAASFGALISGLTSPSAKTPETPLLPTNRANSAAPPSHKVTPSRPDTRTGMGRPADDPRVQAEPDQRRRRFGTRFKVGHYVTVSTPLGPVGAGVVTAVSTEWKNGFGTKTYPAFLIHFVDDTLDWFNGVGLSRISRQQYERERSKWQSAEPGRR